MKFITCFLAIATCVGALPAEAPLEVVEEKLIPKDIYLEPVNPVENKLPESRIIGGSEVSANSIPYQVGVVINGAGFCGGSLISTTSVLTAAHCTIDAAFIEVRLGAHRVNRRENTQVRVTSTSIINHASFEEESFAANDIAVILLPSAVTLNENIQVIPLAPASAGSFEGSTALLTGWGRTSDIFTSLSSVLRGVNLSVIGNADCANVYGDVILNTNICTSGAGTVGACNGDSGGPLVLDGVQVGVVSFGSGRCKAGNPTAYARVSSFRNWIRQNAGV